MKYRLFRPDPFYYIDNAGYFPWGRLRFHRLKVRP